MNNHNEFVAVEIHGPQLRSCPDVTVLAKGPTAESVALAARHEGCAVLPLYVMAGRREPAVGERIGTWCDAGANMTVYAMGPKR